jgi:hypothetical protein
MLLYNYSEAHSRKFLKVAIKSLEFCPSCYQESRILFWGQRRPMKEFKQESDMILYIFFHIFSIKQPSQLTWGLLISSCESKTKNNGNWWHWPAEYFRRTCSIVTFVYCSRYRLGKTTASCSTFLLSLSTRKSYWLKLSGQFI